MSIEVVRQVKEELYAAGENLDGPCGAFKITSNVAWRLKNDGWGLIFSTGNGCDATGTRYRADTIMKQDGSVIDLLIKAENNEGKVYPEVPRESYNIPAWNPTGGQPPSNWREPFYPGVLNPIPIPPDGGNGGGGENPDPPAVDYTARFDAIDTALAALSSQVASLHLEGGGSFRLLGQTISVSMKLDAKPASRGADVPEADPVTIRPVDVAFLEDTLARIQAELIGLREATERQAKSKKGK